MRVQRVRVKKPNSCRSSRATRFSSGLESSAQCPEGVPDPILKSRQSSPILLCNHLHQANALSNCRCRIRIGLSRAEQISSNYKESKERRLTPHRGRRKVPRNQRGHTTSPIRSRQVRLGQVTSDYQIGRNMTIPFRSCLVRLGRVTSDYQTGLNMTSPPGRVWSVQVGLG